MNDLSFFKNEAFNRNLCSQYVDLWASAKNKQMLYNLSMRYNSIRYIALSIYEGWGVSLDYILSEFKDYINGKEVATIYLDDNLQADGLMYVCLNDTSIDMNVDVVNIIKCNNLTINTNRYATQLHINNDSHCKLNIASDGNIMIYLYDTSTIDLGKLRKGQRVFIYDYRHDKTKDGIKYQSDDKCVIIKERSLNNDAFGIDEEGV